MLFVSAWTTSAQVSTNSIQTDASGTVVTIHGLRYVLVPEKTFGKIEKLTAEVPALRDENKTLKAEKANADLIIEGQTRVHELDQKAIGTLENALGASERATASEKEARVALEKALAISQSETAKARADAKKWKKRAVLGWAVAGGALLLTFGF